MGGLRWEPHGQGEIAPPTPGPRFFLQSAISGSPDPQILCEGSEPERSVRMTEERGGVFILL